MPQVSNKKLDEWESLTDTPARHAWQQPNGTGFELRQEVFGYLALQIAHLVREAALTRGARRAFRRSRDHARRPVIDHHQRVGLAGLMAARIAGCDPIIAVDPLPSRLVLARELGATREDFTRDLRQLVMDEV
jgi:hypothetical protein